MTDTNFLFIVARYRDIVAAVRDRIISFLAAQWEHLGSYRDSDIDAFLAVVLPVVLAGQQQVATLTDAYLTTVAQWLTGSAPTAGLDTALITGEVLRGVAPDRVYTRPFHTVWNALALGVAFDEAVRLGGQRLQTIAATDLQLARTHAARATFSEDDRVVGYRRVITGDNTCDLCELASTQRYYSEDLMPIHPNCSCDVEPIYGRRDPGQVIDRQRLDDIHARDVAVDVQEHGELGPVLTVAGQDFRGPDDI